MQTVQNATAHWPEETLHTEHFAAPTGSEAATTGQPFILKLARRGISVPVAAEQTAVDALHDVGIDIPMSCEQGLCGTCVVALAPDQADAADHRDFCLTTSERRSKIALCCSRAKTQELVLDL